MLPLRSIFLLHSRVIIPNFQVILDPFSIMSETKSVQDHELFENADNNYQEDLRYSKLTPDELKTEKQLRRRIDSRIMPLVILVYLMNYMFVLELTTFSQMLM